MLRSFIVLLVLSLGCAPKTPTVTEVPETLTLSTGPASATLTNTDSNGGSWTQTVNVPNTGVTYTMSVYHPSTGSFTVTASAPLNYNYTFGTVSGTGTANPVSTPVVTNF